MTKHDPISRPIVFFPDSKLYEVSVWVSKFDDDLQALAADMVETMVSHQGVGLSAVQVGVNQRVCVISGMPDDKPLVLINPVWSPTLNSTKQRLSEGCLSLPGVFEEVERYTEIDLVWEDLDGNSCRRIFSGVEAHVAQHEIEHLDGRLFIEHLPIHKRDTIRLKMKQRERLTARIDRVMKHNNQSMQDLVRAGIIKLPSRPGFRSGR